MEGLDLIQSNEQPYLTNQVFSVFWHHLYKDYLFVRTLSLDHNRSRGTGATHHMLILCQVLYHLIDESKV